MSKYRERQIIYWGNDDISPRCEQVGMYAELQPDGVLINGYRPDGGNTDIILPYDVFSSLCQWGDDHAGRSWSIWSKLVRCPECASSYCEILRRGYPSCYQFQWQCKPCGHLFTTNYRGYREDEHEEQAAETVTESDDLGDLNEAPF